MRSVAVLVVASLLGSAWARQTEEPAPAPAPTPPPGATSQLSGRVTGHDGAPAAGATVLAYHLSSEQLFRSSATDAKGGFTFEAVPYGYFDLAVLSSDGLYVADAVVNVPPAGRATVALDLVPGATEATLRTFPGTDQQAVGVAGVNRKGEGKGFWGRPAGIAILVGGGAVALAALAGGGDSSEPTSSPSTP